MAKSLEISFAIGAVLTGGFSSAFKQANQAMQNLQGKGKTLSKAMKDISAYQKMQGSLSQTSDKLNQARMRVKDLAQQMKATDNPSASLKAQFTQANKEAHALEQTLGNQRKELAALGKALTDAGIDTRNLTAEQQRLTQQSQRVTDAQNKLTQARKNFQATREALTWDNMKGDVISSAGTVLALGAPTMAAADYEMANAKLNAVAFSGAGRDKEQDKKDFEALKAQSRQLGRDTQYTAVQATQSQENLARAGFTTNEILSAMPGLLNMTAAEGMDLATGADIMASALRGFNLQATDAQRVSNILAQTSAASNTGISELGEAMKYAAPVAQAVGMSIEEASAMIGKMSDSGIKGTMAGTALRGALQRLAKEPKAVYNEFAALGIRAADAQGNFRELPDLLIELDTKLKSMGSKDKLQVLSHIFGDNSSSGMLAVMEASVNGSLQKLTRFNRESTGQLQALSEKTGHSMEILRSGMETSDKAARRVGVSFGELSVYTTMLADANITGATTDKTLTTAFTQLATEPKKVEAALKQFNLSAYDSEGYVKNFSTILTELNASMQNLETPQKIEALDKIFGKDSGAGILSLMEQIKTESFATYTEIANNTSGISGEMSGKMIDTLKGQIEIAKSAISDLSITIGDVLLPSVKNIVTTFSEWTSALGKLASEHPLVTKAIVGLVAGLGSLKVGITLARYAWLALKLPIDAVKLAMAAAQAKALLFGDTSVLLAAKTKIVSAATKSWSVIQAAFNAVMNANPVMLLVTAIGALVAAGIMLYKNWDTIVEWWNNSSLKNLFEPVIEWCSNAYDYVKTKINEFIEWWNNSKLSDIFAPLLGLCSVVIDGVKNIFGGLISWFSELNLPNIFASCSEWTQNAIASVKNLWSDFCNWLSSLNPFSSWKAPAPETVKVGNVEHATGGSRQVANSLQALNSWGIPELHAAGGIFSQPHIGIVAEAGREAIIPLERQSQGTALWLKAGEELGLINYNNAAQTNYVGADTSLLKNFTQSNENSQSLENRLASLNNTRTQNFSSNENGINSNENNTSNVINPVFNITFNETPKNENDFMSMFRNAWEKFQEQELRLSFA